MIVDSGELRWKYKCLLKGCEWVSRDLIDEVTTLPQIIRKPNHDGSLYTSWHIELDKTPGAVW